MIRIIAVLAMPMLLLSCNRATSTPATPKAVAYNDGFEVLVLDVRNGSPTNVRSLALKDAESAIASGSQALIPGDVGSVQRQLATGKSGDSNAVISVQRIATAKQQIKVSFHYGNRTFDYEYLVNGSAIIPIASGYRDLSRSTSVRYTAD